MIDISRPHHSALRAAAVVLISLTLCACDSAGAGTGAYPAEAGDLGLIQDAMKQVEKNYVAPVTGGELAKDALKGMLMRLDPHSDYMDQEQYQQMTAVTRGQFGGIGVELTLEGKVPEVISHRGTSGSRLTSMPGRGIPRSTATSPRSLRFGPDSLSATRASRPQKASFFQPTAQPARAWTGVISSDRSLPCSG